MKNRRVFAGRNSPWVESWLLNWLEVVKITSASTGLFPSPGGAIRAGWCKHRDRRIKQQSSTRRTSQGRSRAPRNTLSFLIALEAVTPREPERRTLPDSALGSGDTGQRPPGAPGQGTPRAPGLDFGAPGLSSSRLGACVLLLMSSRLESWLKKALLVARKRPGGTWLGKSRQDPPGQVQ